MKNDNLSVSRRSFLAGSAAVGAFAAIGLAGCEASTAGKTNDAKASAVEDVAA